MEYFFTMILYLHIFDVYKRPKVLSCYLCYVGKKWVLIGVVDMFNEITPAYKNIIMLQ